MPCSIALATSRSRISTTRSTPRSSRRSSSCTPRAAWPIGGTVRTEFESDDPIRPDLTVPQYLARLMCEAASNVGHAAHVADYAKTVMDLARRRQFIEVGEDMIAAGHDAPVDHAPEALIADAEQRLFALGEGRHVDGFGDLRREMMGLMQAISDARQRGGAMAGLPSGLLDLDAKLGGLRQCHLIIVAGRPSMGKTALASDIAEHLARQGIPVGIFSLEMPRAQLLMRLLSQRAEMTTDV